MGARGLAWSRQTASCSLAKATLGPSARVPRTETPGASTTGLLAAPVPSAAATIAGRLEVLANNDDKKCDNLG